MRAIASLLLLGILCKGCEKEKSPADLLPDSSVELTDGYCLVSGDQVLLNHEDIDYYDYGTHLVYLESDISLTEILEETAFLTVWAGGEEIYTISTQPGYSSHAPVGPVIWTHPTFYEDNVIAIDQIYTYDVASGSLDDFRKDPRIVEALKKYGQYREGLHCEFVSMDFFPGGGAELELKLSNQDELDYYYLDPVKMGMGLFHYFTNGLYLWDDEAHISYDNQVEHLQPEPWDSWDMEWLSLLEGSESVSLVLSYENFEDAPPGNYKASFLFPGLTHVERDELQQQDGRIWLGRLNLATGVVIE